MEFNDTDINEIANKRIAFVQQYGALEIAEDVRFLIDVVTEYRTKERERGFTTDGDQQIIQAFKHISTRDHKHDSKACWQCQHAEETVKKVRDGDI